jgi:hypothetical protein
MVPSLLAARSAPYGVSAPVFRFGAWAEAFAMKPEARLIASKALVVLKDGAFIVLCLLECSCQKLVCRLKRA